MTTLRWSFFTALQGISLLSERVLELSFVPFHEVKGMRLS
jgi:hypothetical protein